MDIRTFEYDIGGVNGAEFVRRARRYARKAGVNVRFDPRRGKGSHGMLYLGSQRTVVKQRELKPGTFRAMLKQLAAREQNPPAFERRCIRAGPLRSALLLGRIALLFP
ncbi:MAG: type II toxin-antitoxin system HicA family toxin, partial [Gemmatimonadota bacterium]|nr:type II toxin-antitoxin system HicA family toxin [Gemmatimonadota bacterium]